jgi:hypothetical protein
MIDPIEALADCIMIFEGWKAPSQIGFPRGSTSWRNRNPGNLRESKYALGKDDKDYCIFAGLSAGYQALTNDLSDKIVLGTHGLTMQSTLHDLFNIYAPALDNNNPYQYSSMIALWLTHIYNVQVTPTTTLADILKLGK